jgi:membrane fusion protein (multidrug efflux system)
MSPGHKGGCVVCLLAMAALAHGQPSSPPLAAPGADVRPSLPKPLPAPPGRRRISDPLECIVEPYMIVNVGSPVDGVLELVAVDRGDAVKQGQVVARLQSGVEAAAVELSRARVEFARRKAERNESLFRKQLISAQDKDEMETELRVHQEELRKDEEVLRLRTIVSPVDGVVVERRLVPGDLIRTDRSVVLKLAQIDPLHVEVVAPAEMFGAMRIGMTGTVNLRPVFPAQQEARVVVVDKLIDAASGTFGVRLEMKNAGNRLPAGLRCTVQFSR